MTRSVTPPDPPPEGALYAQRLHIDPTAYVAPTAVLLGRVQIGPDSSVWPGAVLRGDTAAIDVGSESNLQDGVVVHCDPEYPTRIGDRVTVGHGAVVHGAVVESDCLVAIGAVLLNGVHLGPGSMVGAGAVVPEGMQVPERTLVLGVPARFARPVDDELHERIRQSAATYVRYGRTYREGRLT